MHQYLQVLADQFGLKLTKDPHPEMMIFDGEKLHRTTFQYRWDESLDDYKRMEELRILSDHDLLHDICHFIVADECQRSIPEFGLGNIGIHSMGLNEYFIPNVVSLDDLTESDFQENVTQFLSIYIGEKYKISPRLSSEDDFPESRSWELYFEYKTREMRQMDRSESYTNAVFLRAIELIHLHNL